MKLYTTDNITNIELFTYNFSRKPIILNYYNDYIKFNSITSACNYCLEKYNLPEEYTRGIIFSGELSINNMVNMFNQKSKRNLDKHINIRNLKLINYVKECEKLIKQSDINNTEFFGICAITSVYNCYPSLFNYDKGKIIELLNNIGLDNYDSLINVADEINHILYNKFGHMFKIIYHNANNSYELGNYIHKIIDMNRPVMLAINPKNINLPGHVISLFGYDEFNYYYFENDLDSTSRDLIVSEFLNNLEIYYTEKICDNYDKIKQFDMYYNLIGLSNMHDLIEQHNMSYIRSYIINNMFGRYNQFLTVNKRLINMCIKSSMIAYFNVNLPKNIHLSEIKYNNFDYDRKSW